MVTRGDESFDAKRGIVQPYIYLIVVHAGLEEMERWVVKSRLRSEKSSIPFFRMRLLVNSSV